MRVVLPMADTTTTGFLPRCLRTISPTRSMATASATEVPPNFIMIMRALEPSEYALSNHGGHGIGGFIRFGIHAREPLGLSMYRNFEAHPKSMITSYHV